VSSYILSYISQYRHLVVCACKKILAPIAYVNTIASYFDNTRDYHLGLSNRARDEHTNCYTVAVKRRLAILSARHTLVPAVMQR